MTNEVIRLTQWPYAWLRKDWRWVQITTSIITIIMVGICAFIFIYLRVGLKFKALDFADTMERKLEYIIFIGPSAISSAITFWDNRLDIWKNYVNKGGLIYKVILGRAILSISILIPVSIAQCFIFGLYYIPDWGITFSWSRMAPVLSIFYVWFIILIPTSIIGIFTATYMNYKAWTIALASLIAWIIEKVIEEITVWLKYYYYPERIDADYETLGFIYTMIGILYLMLAIPIWYSCEYAIRRKMHFDKSNEVMHAE